MSLELVDGRKSNSRFCVVKINRAHWASGVWCSVALAPIKNSGDLRERRAVDPLGFSKPTGRRSLILLYASMGMMSFPAIIHQNQ